MTHRRRRQQIAWEAARLMCFHDEADFGRARWKAAFRLGEGHVAAEKLPGRREIRGELARLERSLAEHDGRDDVLFAAAAVDRFRTYEVLLAPLEQVKESRKSHPEGDLLYHSLQVFELARHELPYDEEFLLAALLHDVGKAIEPKDHIAAALDALDGAITPRTAWFIAHHLEAQSAADGGLGARSLRRLSASADFAELRLLAQCDRRGRVRGAAAPELPDALDYLRQLAAEDEGD